MADPPTFPRTLIDLSHTIEHGLVTYKGLPAPIICDYLSREASRKHYAPGTEFQIGKIEMVANTGTYLDSPFHRYADGKDLSQLELQKLANLPAIKVLVEHKQAIDISCFPRGEDLAGKAVLVETGWSRHWNTAQYFEGHPFLTEDAARFLADSEAALVGIDSHNIDDVEDLRRPVHSILLKNEIPVVEHMTNLPALPARGFQVLRCSGKSKGVRHISGTGLRDCLVSYPRIFIASGPNATAPESPPKSFKPKDLTEFLFSYHYASGRTVDTLANLSAATKTRPWSQSSIDPSSDLWLTPLHRGWLNAVVW